MRLVVDANVLFSFFKRGSLTRKLITSPELLLFAPALSLYIKYSFLLFETQINTDDKNQHG